MLINRKQSGFSMIELMIGLAIGLIISGAVIAFVAATLKANSETIQSMKLNHELRALSELIARDIRRARSMEDPLANIGTGCSTDPTSTSPEPCAGLDFNDVDISTAGCILYAYDSPDGNDLRAVRLATTSGVGAVLFNRQPTTAPTCTSGGTQISSNLLDIESMTFTNCTYTDAATGTAVTMNDCINLTLSAKLVNDPDNITYTYRTSIGVRSGQIN